VPCVVGPQADAALEVIEAARNARARRCWPMASTGMSPRNAGGWSFRTKPACCDLPLPNLPGAHQYENAGAALAVLRHLGLRRGGVRRP
jgi:dihydrofolate synthase/folylpolyglutamate synthase